MTQQEAETYGADLFPEALAAITSDLDPHRAFESFANALRPVIPFHWLVLAEIRDGVYRRMARVGPDSHLLPIGALVSLDKNPARVAVQTRSAVVVQDTAARKFEYDSSLHEAGVGSYIIQPLIADERVFATVNCFFNTPQAATSARVAILASAAPAVAQGVRHMLAFEREEELIERLREINELKTDFLAMVAHEIRTPITLIGGYAELLRDRWPNMPDEEKLRIADVIAQRSAGLSSLVGDVLGVAAIEAGAITFDVAPFDLTEMVQEVVDAGLQDQRFGIRSTTGPGAMKVDIDAKPNLPPAAADRGRQALVLENVLWNAFVQSPVDEAIEVTLSHCDGMLCVAVTDRGPGLNDELKEKLFQRFSRLPLSPRQDIKGTGLGLYTSKHLIEAQGGDMWVESEVGRGTTLSYTVPAAPSNA